jgi:hypothetical protein
MKIPEHLHSQIEGLRATFMLLQGMSAADATRKAISEVKAAEQAKPKTQPATSTAPKVSRPVDAETKRDADFVRNALLRDFDVDVLEDLADMSDDDLRNYAEESGIA